MSRTEKRPLPTDGELAILRVLWSRGPSTVRDVHEALPGRSTGYTTVLKLLQIMLDKGLVARDESARAHIYAAAEAAESTQRRLVDNLVGRAFAGSASQLVMRALASEKASSAEIDEIRALLDRLEEEPR